MTICNIQTYLNMDSTHTQCYRHIFYMLQTFLYNILKLYINITYLKKNLPQYESLEICLYSRSSISVWYEEAFKSRRRAFHSNRPKEPTRLRIEHRYCSVRTGQRRQTAQERAAAPSRSTVIRTAFSNWTLFTVRAVVLIKIIV